MFTKGKEMDILNLNKKVKFRASIYFDIVIADKGDTETNRKEAKKIAEEFANEINLQGFINNPNFMSGNAFVGGVALYDPSNLLNPLDKEI